MGEGVFLMTEVLLDETPEPSVMVPRMLDMLVGAQQSFYDTLRERLFSESGFRNRFRDRRRPCTAAAGRWIGDGARNVPSGSLSPRNRPISRADSALARELRS